MSAKRRMTAWLVLIVLLGLGWGAYPTRAAAPAPAPVWTSGGLYGGPVDTLATHPAAPNRVYALIESSGPFRSDDGGLTWQRIASGLPFKPGEVRFYSALAVDPTAPDRLYLGLGAPGSPELAHVYRSTNAGASWEPRASGLPAAEITALVVDPQQTQVVYCGTYNGLYRSTDGGASWQARGHNGRFVWSIAVDPTRSDHLLALVDNQVYASDDGGANWRLASAGLPTGSSVTPSAQIAFDPGTPGTAYLAGLIVQGFFRSTDGGETWTAVNEGLGTGAPTLTALIVQPPAVYAATMAGLYRLDGTYWTRVSSDLSSEMGSFPNALAAGGSAGPFYLGYWHGIYRSTDGGASWSATGPGLQAGRIEAVGVDPQNGQRVLAAAGNRLYRSTDAGTSWTPALPRESSVALMIAVDPRNPNHIYYSSNLQPLRHSLDGGLTWSLAPNAEALPYDVRAIRFHATDPQRLYLAGPHNFSSQTTQQGVYRSTDGGQTWQHIETQLRAVEMALSADGATVYAASTSQILRSPDGGDTWTPAENGLPVGWGFVYGLEAHPTDPNVAWLATGGAGVFITTNRGASWQPMNDGLPGGYVTDLRVRTTSGGAVLYAATRYGVYVSRSGGAWTPLGAPLPDYAQWTNSLAVASGGQVYVGTDTGGLWTLQDESAPPPPPPPQDACRGIPLGRGQIWLAETGFAVQGVWLDWFNSHGGLDILGFPRSPVTPDPLNPSQCVQYFQRGVLEWHPQNPDPYRIQRRLLAQLMMPGIDPAVPARPNSPDYLYFPQTGHAVSNHAPDGRYIGFKVFFERHGREDTFGYPLEEPKLRRGSDGVERWTQRFQAAVFEYHQQFDIPGNKPGTNIPWRNWIVQLALVGDQFIAQNNLQFGLTCSQPPMLGFGKIWHDYPLVQQRLRCPRGLEVGTTITEQSFQHGWMFRRDDRDQIYVLRDTGQWSVYPDTWQPGMPEIDPAISVPPGVYQPRQGLGQVWRALSHPPVYDGGSLFWATAPDRSFSGSVQDMERGTMIWSDRRIIYVLYDTGTWESYTDYFGQ